MVKNYSSIVVLVSVVTSVAFADVRVTIGPDPTITLPDVSPELRITLENEGPIPVQVTNEFAQRVWKRDDPVAELSRGGFRGENPVGEIDGFEDGATLEPGATLELYLPQGTSPWFRDLYEPGEYRVQILTPLGNSNEITMIVQQPEGVDAEVWELIRERGGSGGIFNAIDLSRMIWSDYPESIYAFYLAPVMSSAGPEEEIEAYSKAMAISPDHPVADRYRVLIAQAHQDLAGKLVRERKLEEALVHAETARELLEALGTSREVYVRSEATRLLRRNYTWDGIQRSDRIRHGPPFFEIEPVCFTATQKGFDVLFESYRTKADLDLPVGDQNKFTPAPFDLGQPTHFDRGALLLPWRLQHEGPQKQLVWHINGERIKLSAQEAEKQGLPPCPARDADAEQWWIDLD